MITAVTSITHTDTVKKKKKKKKNFFLFVVKTYRIYSFNFPICPTAVLAVVIMLYVTSTSY